MVFSRLDGLIAGYLDLHLTDQVHGLPVPILRSALKAIPTTVTNGAGRENEARRRGSR